MGAIQHAGGRIADQNVIALADGDQVLRLRPQARQDGFALGRRPGRGECGPRGAGESQPQGSLGRWLRGGEARECRRGTGDVAQRLPAIQRQLRRLDAREAIGPVNQR